MEFQKAYVTSRILHRVTRGANLRPGEITHLLSISCRQEADEVFAAAREVRSRYFGNRVFLYGFIYFSTYCRNNCSFCYYRQDNGLSPRYRKDRSEILGIAKELADSGVHLIDLTMGEDPEIHRQEGYGQLIELVAAVKQVSGLPVMVSPGVVPEETLRQLAGAGADWYALYQETHSRQLFKQLRLGQSFEMRNLARIQAEKAGLLVEDGILLGVGESLADRVHSLRQMSGRKNGQVRVMSLVPQEDTPLSHLQSPSRLTELLAIAVLRLLNPDRLIPASLDVEGLQGLAGRLAAGANVVTSIIPPAQGLAGVSQSTLDINEGGRTVAGVTPVLKQMGLTAASLLDYRYWMNFCLEKERGHNHAHRYRGWPVARC